VTEFWNPTGPSIRFPRRGARQVRPAQFSDPQGLIQGLSTGIQGQLDKLAKRDEGRAGPVAVAQVLRLASRPVFLAGREGLLAALDARLTADMLAAEAAGQWYSKTAYRRALR
jgi:hypothetical protein